MINFDVSVVPPSAASWRRVSIIRSAERLADVLTMFEIQHHPPVSYDGKQYSDYVLQPDFGSPPNRYVPPPPQFQQESTMASPSKKIGPPMPFSPIGESNSSMGLATSTPRAYRDSETSPVRSVRRFQNRSGFTPSRSPPASLLSSPAYHSTRARCGLSDESHDDSNRSYEFSFRNAIRRSALPERALDPASGRIILTFEEIVDQGLFEEFAKDRDGSTFLQENYPDVGSTYRNRIFSDICAKEQLFHEMCKDVFANFVVQKMIELSTHEEKKWIADTVSKSMFALCMNRYSCRVVQKVIEYLPDDLKVPLLDQLHDTDLVLLTVDQNANHVIQKIFNSFEIRHWCFIISALMKDRNFFDVVENKYGCRVIQLAIQLLSEGHDDSPMNSTYNTIRRNNMQSALMPVSPFVHADSTEWATVISGSHKDPTRDQLLKEMMSRLLDNCERLSSNEFANYVIQHVIMTPCLSEYRDMIIERSLLCKLLSLSQEKYASHVVEKAMEHASPSMLREMMDEIFDGYVPHPETKKDALDILLFHQFGNYVVQRMLTICLNTNSPLERRVREHWLIRLEERISRNQARLLRYSSGKKILDMLRSGRGQHLIAPIGGFHRNQSSNNNTGSSPRVPDHFR